MSVSKNGSSLIRTQAPNYLSFDAVYSEYSVMVRQIAVRRTRCSSDADDVCQAVWLIVHQRLPTVQSHAAIRGWLRTITIRAIFDLPKPAKVLDHDIAGTKDSPVDAAIAAEDADNLRKAIGKLSKNNQRIVKEFYLHQIPVRFIAAGSSRTVRRRLRKSCKILAEMLS